MNKWITLTAIILTALLLVVGCMKSNSQNIPPQSSENPSQPNEVQESSENDNESHEYTVELYFSDSDLMKLYRVHTTVEVEDIDQLPIITINKWIEGPDHENLTSLLPQDIEVYDVQIQDGIAYVNFSEHLLHANLGSSGEMFLVDQIALMMNQFGYEQTRILIEGEIVESLLGHVSTDEPIHSPDPSEIETIN